MVLHLGAQGHREMSTCLGSLSGVWLTLPCYLLPRRRPDCVSLSVCLCVCLLPATTTTLVLMSRFRDNQTGTCTWMLNHSGYCCSQREFKTVTARTLMYCSLRPICQQQSWTNMSDRHKKFPNEHVGLISTNQRCEQHITRAKKAPVKSPSAYQHLVFYRLAAIPPVLWHCWLGVRKGIRPVKHWALVCWWWRFDWSFARLIAAVVATTFVILSSNETG